METILIFLTAVVVLTPAIVLHEFAHGWIANQLGDSTARLAGRLTLNPLKHVDPVGTVLIPGTIFLLNFFRITHGLMPFGWAKPIPVNFRALNNPKRDMIWVALAGPAVNIMLASFFSLFWKLDMSTGWRILLEYSIYLNLYLAVFNLVPIPPLDGSRIMMGLLPRDMARAYSQLEPFGLLIVVVLINMGFFSFTYPLVDYLANLLGVGKWI